MTVHFTPYRPDDLPNYLAHSYDSGLGSLDEVRTLLGEPMHQYGINVLVYDNGDGTRLLVSLMPWWLG